MLEELAAGVLSDADRGWWGEILLRCCCPSRLLLCPRYVGRDTRQQPQWEDGDKVGHFSIVFEPEQFAPIIHHRYLPQGPTYIKQSDKRDALTVFLSPRFPVSIKELLLTHILNGVIVETGYYSDKKLQA